MRVERLRSAMLHSWIQCMIQELFQAVHLYQYLLNLQRYVVVQLLICVWLLATPWTTALQASLSFTISWSLLKLMSIESMMPSNRLILCCPLLLLSSIFSSIRAFSNRVGSLHQVAKVLELQFQLQPLQWIIRVPHMGWEGGSIPGLFFVCKWPSSSCASCALLSTSLCPNFPF